MKDKISYIQKLFALAKNGFIRMFSANVLNKALGIVNNMIVLRLISKAEFGVLSYIFNFYAYLSLASGLGLNSGALVFGTENHGTDKEHSYYGYTLKWGLIINSAVVFISYVILLIVTIPFPAAKPLLFAYLPMLLLEYSVEVLLVIPRANNKVKVYANLMNINTILMVVGTCLGAIYNLEGIIVGKYIGEVVTLIVICFFLREDIKKFKCVIEEAKNKVIELWKYSIATSFSTILNCLLYLLDVTMIAMLLKDDEMVATYKVATMIPNALQFIPASFVICILPSVITNRNDKNWLKSHIKEYYVEMAILNLVIATLVICGARIIITIISGAQYVEAVPAFRVLTVGYAISGTFRIVSTNILAALKRVKYNIIISIVTGCMDVIFNYSLIMRYRMNGAAFATLLAEIVASVISFCFLSYTVHHNENVLKE